nr:PAAR domain-containing protein [Enterobacter asburiae]
MLHSVSINGLELALDGDETTTGASCISSLRTHQDTGRGMVRVGDTTTVCPVCKCPGIVVTGTSDFIVDGARAAVHGSEVKCGCPAGQNRVIVSSSAALSTTQAFLQGAGRPSSRIQTQEPTAASSPLPSFPAPAATGAVPQEVTLTIGLFFDGTGNNAVNTENMIKACTARHYDYTSAEAEVIMARCAREAFGVSGTGAGSYIGYYTNVHWLHTLYQTDLLPDSTAVQASLYIDGIGTEAGKPDSLIGQSMGIADTGVIAKTDKAVAGLAQTISQSIESIKTELNAEKLT